MMPDAECVRIVSEILSSLDVGKYLIKVNHRKILDGMFETCGVKNDMFRTICSSVDKLDKTPWEEVRTEMTEEKKLAPEVADKIGEYVRLPGGGLELVNDLLEKDLGKSKLAKEGLEDMALFLKYCDILGCGDKVSFEMSLARGLDYYTGVIYEAVLLGTNKLSVLLIRVLNLLLISLDDTGAQVGSVAGGGRYDNLVGMFDPKNRTVPCVGVSLGVERLFAVMEAKAAKDESADRGRASVYVATAQKNLHEERLRVCRELWDADVKTEQPYKKSPKMLNQLQYCEENGIPLAVIIGESEIQAGVVKLRVIKTREEKEVKREQLADTVKQILADGL